MTETREQTLKRESRELLRGILQKPLIIRRPRVLDKIYYIGPCTSDCPHRINEPGVIKCGGECVRDNI